ncbi:hypothetical protein HYV72_02630, partial [Candidatus Uhrbacteria bacterium]|nr:hypothetical protein [Candidatus Uhrbacteria bacterium]
EGPGVAKSIWSLYKQQRRWAWGVEHFPYIMAHMWRDERIPRRTRRRLLWNHMEGMFTWATAPIIIFVLGWLPMHMAATDPRVLAHNAPFTLKWVMTIGALGIIVSGLMSLSLLPPRPRVVHRSQWVAMIVQWLLLPITFIVFGAIPSIDAQTRLMIGRYLGFNVTKKRRSYASGYPSRPT